jgi:hypothetical protein
MLNKKSPSEITLNTKELKTEKGKVVFTADIAL